VVSRPIDTWNGALVNDFEESVFALYPEIGAIKQQLLNMGATYAAMSGSGSALFGLFKKSPIRLGQEFPNMFTFSSLF
jgi:4-diphosphocytidyl-2-C-methyl-D-erythritol kinase